jgi:hypothetical protein
MATTTRRARKVAKITSVALGFGLGVTAVLGFSNAAFLAQTNPNGQNNWATGGAVTLTEQFTAPMFSFGIDGANKPTSNNLPKSDWDGYLDATGTDGRTVGVTYKGDLNANVRMYVSNSGTVTAGKNLKDKTLVTITRQVGAGPVDTLYTDAPLSSLPTSFAAATGPKDNWQVNAGATTPNDKATYTVSIKAGSGIDAASTLKGVEFKWEAQHR